MQLSFLKNSVGKLSKRNGELGRFLLHVLEVQHIMSIHRECFLLEHNSNGLSSMRSRWLLT